jgi:hypothetical protein
VLKWPRYYGSGISFPEDKAWSLMPVKKDVTHMEEKLANGFDLGIALRTFQNSDKT